MNSMSIVILGLSITSSWGNGHATTYRALVRALVERGHRVTFLERDVPWYTDNRDLPDPPWGRTYLYRQTDDLHNRFFQEIAGADLVIVGSYVPEGITVSQWVLEKAGGRTAFYDIDTPVTLAGLERDDIEYITAGLIPRFDIYLSFTGGPTLERLEREFGSPMARPLYCSADPELYYPETVTSCWDLGYLGTYSPDRQEGLAELLHTPARRWPEGRFIIAGPRFPDSRTWSKNIEWIPHLPPSEHRNFYNSQRFTLNVTRNDMVRAGWSPSVRLFEAAACGVPVISDWWEGLDEFFEPDREILISRSAGQTLDYLQILGEEKRKKLGRRARRKILEAHTAGHRAAELETYMETLLKKKWFVPRHTELTSTKGDKMAPKLLVKPAKRRGAAAVSDQGMRILVTGGAGFIGSHLCGRLLDQGNEIWCLDDFSTGAIENITGYTDHPRFQLLKHNIIYPLKNVEVDRIYNLACPASPNHYQLDPVRTTKTIVLGALNMLELARKLHVPILQASTSEVYGDPEVHRQTEDYCGKVNQIGRRACYEEGKRCAESLFFDYFRQYNLPIKICRIFNTYGPQMRPDDGRVISNFLLQALQNQPLTVFGQGRQTRSFCYIDDLVEAMIRLMETPPSFLGPVNLGNPAEITIMELVELIREITGSASEVIYHDLPEDDPRQRRPDITLARKVLDWEPQITLRDGLGHTAEYFRQVLRERAAAGRKKELADRSGTEKGEPLPVLLGRSM